MSAEKSNDSTAALVGPGETLTTNLKAEPDPEAAPPASAEPQALSEEHMRDPVARFTSLGFSLAEIDHARLRYPHWWHYYSLGCADLTLWQAFRAIPCGAGDFMRHWEEDGCTFLEAGGTCRVPMCGRVEGPVGEAATEAEGEAAVESFKQEGPSWWAMKLALAATGVAVAVEKVLGRAY